MIPADPRLTSIRFLRDGISAINTQIGAGNVASSIAQQERNRPHEVFRPTHFALRD